MASVRETLPSTLKEKIKSQGKYFTNVSRFFFLCRYSLSFMKIVSKYFDCDLCLAKIKVEEPLKTIAFDVKNHRLTVMSYDRVLYFFDIPQEQTRYVPQAEVRTF